MDPVAAIASLQEQKERGLAISSDPHPDADARQRWYNTARAILSAAFGPDSPNISAVMHAGPPGQVYPFGTPDAVIEAANMRNLHAAAMMLDSCIEQLRLLGPTLPDIRTGRKSTEPGTSVFIVHGRDEGKKEAVARFVGMLGLRPIILHEQANLGRTLIEKFEAHADVSFAVVILTGDDTGSSNDRPGDTRARGRQNVVFELGYFVGRLGRKKVCTLYEEGVEIPSDFDGIVYVPLDAAGAWRTLLARELKAAGFAVDMNRAL